MTVTLPVTFAYGNPTGANLTYGQMQTRIADELDRSDLMLQIQKAIVSAVSFYERKKFYFSETVFTFNTVVGQEYYTVTDNVNIPTAPYIERLNILFSSIRLPMTRRQFEWIDDVSALPVALGVPTDWAYRAEQIRLYPIPSQVWTITGFIVPRLTMLSQPTDTNAWTNDAEELIRARAKVDLIDNVIRSPEMVQERQIQAQREIDARTALYAETASRKATGVITPTSF